MVPVLILHHHEIILKGGNRKFFERYLLKNVRLALSEFPPVASVSGGYGRFVVHLHQDSPTDRIIDSLSRVFGIANICLGVQVNPGIEEFCAAAEQLLKDVQFATFRIETRRIDKSFPIRSMEVNSIVGEFVRNRYAVRAQMKDPDQTISIQVVEGKAYVYRSKTQGALGLPAGVSGRVVALLSAGFDSPVAAWRLMRRGAKVIFVHFHSMPYTSQNSVDQVRSLATVLTKYQFWSKLYLVPFAEAQQELVLRTPQHLRVILYRRMMIRIADAIAQRENAEALVTGEAVGQVASQTLRNIRAIDEAAKLPVLRPLSGSDKEETMATARRIGTYDISKEPYDDCCSFLAPRNPETWASLDEVHAAEEKVQVDQMIGAALEKAIVETFQYPLQQHAPAEEPASV